MVLGLYYLTKELKSTPERKVKGEGRTFYSAEEVIIALNEQQVELHAKIKVRARVEDKATGALSIQRIDTTVGRVIFNQVVPETVPYINVELKKKDLKLVIGDMIRRTNIPITAEFLDGLLKAVFLSN
jgi:DNA-directed RNA polymerase subunit beta'